jgi:hypothetical protein
MMRGSGETDMLASESEGSAIGGIAMSHDLGPAKPEI